MHTSPEQIWFPLTKYPSSRVPCHQLGKTVGDDCVEPYWVSCYHSPAKMTEIQYRSLLLIWIYKPFESRQRFQERYKKRIDCSCGQRLSFFCQVKYRIVRQARSKRRSSSSIFTGSGTVSLFPPWLYQGWDEGPVLFIGSASSSFNNRNSIGGQ
jgi:hypothetical protein